MKVFDQIFDKMSDDAVIGVAIAIAYDLRIPCFTAKELSNFQCACKYPYDVPKMRRYLQKLHNFAVERTKNLDENNLMSNAEDKNVSQ